MTAQRKLPSILFLFPHPVADTLAEVRAGLAPTDRLYGLVELSELGHLVSTCDAQFFGPFAGLRARLRRIGIFLPALGTIRQIARHDVLVVKDDFSLFTTCIARLLQKKVIYLDAMFNLPRRRWKKSLIALSILLANDVFAYSKAQILAWSKDLGVSVNRFTFIPYTVDVGFYTPAPATERRTPYVLSVGRDMGRDFPTLIEAMRNSGLELVLVTLPYLLPKGWLDERFVVVKERVSYAELRQLYAGATLVVVPLSGELLYPSGIRAVLEAALLRKATIATRTPVLAEYVSDGEELVFVDPQDSAALRESIRALSTDSAAREVLEFNAERKVRSTYQMELLCKQLSEAASRDGRSV